MPQPPFWLIFSVNLLFISFSCVFKLEMTKNIRDNFHFHLIFFFFFFSQYPRGNIFGVIWFLFFCFSSTDTFCNIWWLPVFTGTGRPHIQISECLHALVNNRCWKTFPYLLTIIEVSEILGWLYNCIWIARYQDHPKNWKTSWPCIHKPFLSSRFNNRPELKSCFYTTILSSIYVHKYVWVFKCWYYVHIHNTDCCSSITFEDMIWWKLDDLKSRMVGEYGARWNQVFGFIEEFLKRRSVLLMFS